MISLKGKKKLKGILDTKEKVKELIESLENATKDEFEKFRIAKIKSWSKTKNKMLD